MKHKFLALALMHCLLVFPAKASDDHDHAKEKKEAKLNHDVTEDSGKEEVPAHEHEHGSEEEKENAQVGPDKGILSATEGEGIKLSPEAEKNFEIEKVRITGITAEIPRRAVVTAIAESNVFRYRGGFYKRIDFVTVNRSPERITIKSTDLKPGDEIVVRGQGFLRLAELAAFGGAPEGHSH